MVKVIAEVIGIIGIICSILSFQCSTEKKCHALSGVGKFDVLYTTVSRRSRDRCMPRFHQFFHESFFSIDKKWAKSNWWLALFILLLLAAGIATWQNAYSILPMIGSLLSTVALWMKTSKKIRLISFFSGPCWLIYNVVNGAYSAAVNELIAMTSIAIGILRHDIKKKQCG